jgi:hypothetical protein
MFSNGGKLKKNDPFLFCIFPLVYLIFATIAGFCGLTYPAPDGTTRHFPYWFLDYEKLGWLCVIFIIVILAIYNSFCFLIYYIDCKRGKASKQQHCS